MPFLVSDTSVIIDLERGDLLEPAFVLNDTMVVPDLLFAQELDDDFGQQLVAMGLRVEELDSAEVARATALRRAEARLSIADTFAYALARGRGWVLLTGDAVLRAAAAAEGIEVHGVLWVLDRIEHEGACDTQRLHDGLSRTFAHPRCRLPRREVDIRLRRYAAA